MLVSAGEWSDDRRIALVRFVDRWFGIALRTLGTSDARSIRSVSLNPSVASVKALITQSFSVISALNAAIFNALESVLSIPRMLSTRMYALYSVETL